MSYGHDLARRYNADLAGRDYCRADEIEWVADGAGNVKLRDRPEWTAANTRRQEQRRERDRKRYVEELHAERRPSAPAEQTEIDGLRENSRPPDHLSRTSLTRLAH